MSINIAGETLITRGLEKGMTQKLATMMQEVINLTREQLPVDIVTFIRIYQHMYRGVYGQWLCDLSLDTQSSADHTLTVSTDGITYVTHRGDQLLLSMLTQDQIQVLIARARSLGITV